MKIGDHNMPGPGDPETWPAYSGHHNDPRAPDEDDREWDDLSDDEKIAQLLELPQRELAIMYLDAIEERDGWRRQCYDR
jgi:hypothetical protein